VSRVDELAQEALEHLRGVDTLIRESVPHGRGSAGEDALANLARARRAIDGLRHEAAEAQRHLRAVSDDGAVAAAVATAKAEHQAELERVRQKHKAVISQAAADVKALVAEMAADHAGRASESADG